MLGWICSKTRFLDLLALHEDDIQHFEVSGGKNMKMYEKWGIYPSKLDV